MENQILKDKLILVTGASRGIGRAVAIKAASSGAEVILTGRTTGALEEVDDEIVAVGGKATIVELDQTDTEAMPRLAQAIASRWGRLDGFVANAGQLGQMAPLAHTESEVFERTIQVNLTSIWHQIQAFDGLLRAAPAGRAVFVTSKVAQTAPAYWSAYAISKAGLETMAKIYAAETEQTNLRVNIIDPGSSATAMRASAFPGEDKNTLPQPDKTAQGFIPLLSEACTSHGKRWHVSELWDSENS